MTPFAAASPYALPPVRTTAWTRSMTVVGCNRSVSRVPGPPPRTSTPPTAPPRASTTVVPVSQPSLSAVWWPISNPSITRSFSPTCQIPVELWVNQVLTSRRLSRVFRHRVERGAHAEHVLEGRTGDGGRPRASDDLDGLDPAAPR